MRAPFATDIFKACSGCQCGVSPLGLSPHLAGDAQASLVRLHQARSQHECPPMMGGMQHSILWGLCHLLESPLRSGNIEFK